MELSPWLSGEKTISGYFFSSGFEACVLSSTTQTAWRLLKEQMDAGGVYRFWPAASRKKARTEAAKNKTREG